MGCSSSVQALYHPSSQFTQSPIGLLSVTLLSFSFHSNHHFLFAKQTPHAKITVSNQSYMLKKNVEADMDKETTVDESFEFIINSCYQPHGRTLDCQIWNEGFLVGGQIGKSHIDLNNLIAEALTEDIDCPIYLNEEVQGNIKFKVSFTPYPYDTLSFRFIDALVINKRQEDLSKRSIYVRIQIGEEILETKPSSETPKALPHWENEILTFRVPRFCETGRITLHKRTVDSEMEMGSFEVDIQNLLQTRIQRMFDQIFSHFHHGKEEVKGTLKFYTLRGSKNFIDPKSSRKEKENKNSKFQICAEEVKNSVEKEVKRREREQIKQRLMLPLPQLKKRSTTNMILRKMQLQNPEP